MTMQLQWGPSATLAIDPETHAVATRPVRLAGPTASTIATGPASIAGLSAATYTMNAANVTIIENYADSPGTLCVRFNTTGTASPTNCDKRIVPGETFVLPLPVASMSIYNMADDQVEYNTHFSIKGW